MAKDNFKFHIERRPTGKSSSKEDKPKKDKPEFKAKGPKGSPRPDTPPKKKAGKGDFSAFIKPKRESREESGGRGDSRDSRGSGKEFGRKGDFKGKREFGRKEDYREEYRSRKEYGKKSNSRVRRESPTQGAPLDGPIRLNRFIARAGVCSRREADVLISEGKIKVNGEVTTEMGVKVVPGKDKVQYAGKQLRVSTFTYILMNKPKNHITTTKDDKGRRTVMDIVRRHTKDRVYPVGRLDRNTTGLLLFTNDGDLTEKLTHPSHSVKKRYQVSVDKPITDEALNALAAGLELEDGPIQPDKVEHLILPTGEELSIELHSGRNRIVRRMMEHLGYQVVKLDRVAIGPLTKKGLTRGSCRPLTDKEIGFLRML